MKIIGITGNIASGKSTISKIIAEHLNVPLISVDEFSKNWIKTYELYVETVLNKHNLYSNGANIFTILRENLFNNLPLKRRLEDLISGEFWEYVSDINQYHKFIVIEHPLMFEMDQKYCFDYVVGVHCDVEIRVDRMLERGYTSETIKQRLAAQIPFQQNAKYCDLVINTTNDPTREDVIQQLQNSERFEALVSQGTIS